MSSQSFYEMRILKIKNFNRLFNFISILFNLAIYGFLKIMAFYFSKEDNSASNTKFLIRAIEVSKVSILMNLTLFAAIQKYNKKHYELLAIFNNVLFTICFQIISGVFRSYLFYTSDPLLFVTSFEILVRYIIITYFYTSFRITAYSSTIIILYSWISMILYHHTIPSPLIFYNSIITLVFCMLSLYSKTYEQGIIIEAELKNTRENERNYYINILDNLNVGFFISEGSSVKISNKFVTNIMTIYDASRNLNLEEGDSPVHKEKIMESVALNQESSKSINLYLFIIL